MKSFFALFGLLFLGITASACTCAYSTPWCESVQWSKPDIVVKGLVYSFDEEAAYIKIIETLEGTPNAALIKVPYGNGALCYGGLSSAYLNNTYIFALNVVTASDTLFSEYTNFKIGDYYFSLCGEYVLEVKNGKVIGNIFADIREMDYEDFITSYKTCDFNRISIVHEYPIPASDFIHYEIFTTEGNLEVEIFDITGKLIFRKAYQSQTFYRLDINLPYQSYGLHVIRFTAGDLVETRKLLVHPR